MHSAYVKHNLVDGLIIHRSMIPNPADVLAVIDGDVWLNTLSRRTQHYGYMYNYQARVLLETERSMESNTAISYLSTGLENLLGIKFDQCIVNEYVAKQNISAHIDAAVFGPVVVSVSLCGEGTLIFRRGYDEVEVVVMPGDVMVLTGDARYKWTHETKKKYSQHYRRVSATFRTVNTDAHVIKNPYQS